MPQAPAPRRPPAKILPPEAPGVRALASLVTGVVIICALYFGRAVMIPIILAILLSFLLAPFVDVLRRLRFGQVPSVIVAVVVALSVLTAVGALIGACYCSGQSAGEFARLRPGRPLPGRGRLVRRGPPVPPGRRGAAARPEPNGVAE